MPYEAPSYFIPPPIKGQRYDLAKYNVPEDAAWMLSNFVLRDGKVCVRPGYQDLGSTLSNRVAGMTAYTHSGGTDLLVAATKVGWWKWNVATQAWVDISQGGNALATADDDFQVFRVFYKSGTSYLVGVNGYTDNPIKWDGAAANYSDVGGSPSKAKCLVVLANRMLMGNLDGGPLTVDVSGFNDFETGWGSTQTAVLADTSGPIVAMQEMGALTAAIYKTDAWYVCTAAPGTYPFTFTLKQAGISGPASAASVVPTPLGHYILGRDCNVYRCDGSVYSSLGEHIRSHVLHHVDINKLHRSWGMYDHLKNEIWFFFVENGSSILWPTQGIVIRLADQTVWPVSFDSDYMQPTAGLQTILETQATLGTLTGTLGSYTSPLGSYGTRQAMQVIGNSGGIVAQEGGDTDRGDIVVWGYESSMRCPSPEHKFTTVTQMESFFKRNIGYVYQTLYYSDENAENTENTYRIVYMNERGPYVSGARVSSRFFSLRLTGFSQEAVEYQGTRLYGVERGRR